MLSYDIKKLYKMSEDEIWSTVFAASLEGHAHSLFDVFGVDGVYALVSHSEYSSFSRHLQSFIWTSIQAMDIGDKIPTRAL